MKVTIGKHVERLQKRLERLHRLVVRPDLTRRQRDRVEEEIRAAILGLEHLQAALAAERKLSRPISK